MTKRGTAELGDNTPQPDKKSKTMELPYRGENVTAPQANVLKDMNTYTEDAQAAKDTGPTENLARFTDVYRREMEPDNNAAKRQELLRVWVKNNVEKISKDLNGYHEEATKHYRKLLEDALNSGDVDAFMKSHGPEMKPDNDAARQDLHQTLEKTLPASDVKRISDKVDEHLERVEQYYRGLLKEALNQEALKRPYVDGQISLLEHQQKEHQQKKP